MGKYSFEYIYINMKSDYDGRAINKSYNVEEWMGKEGVLHECFMLQGRKQLNPSEQLVAAQLSTGSTTKCTPLWLVSHSFFDFEKNKIISLC